MQKPADNGHSQRANLQALADLGNLTAIAALDGPPMPAALEYLHAWHGELARARRITEHGPAPLTYQDLLAWSLLTAQDPEPHEVEALMALDLVSLYPGDVAA